ncbi:MAG: hypothetical protein GC134_06115 [Proteobacteria bacterium]|nr:hypothetical protein [Pseudomonadota bacterium]
MVENLQILVLGFLTVFLYMAAGRLVFTHIGQHKWATPFNTLLTGAGIWYLWFLMLHGLLGASMKLVWWLFAVSVVGLLLVMTKAHQMHDRTMKFFWPVIMVVLVVTLPAFWYLTGDSPMLWGELTHYVKNADHIFRLDGLPTAADAAQFAIYLPPVPMGLAIVVLPVSIIMGKFVPAAFAMFGLALVAAASGHMVRISGVQVGWHNVVLSTVFALFALTVMNPFFKEMIIFSGYPDMLIAALLFAVCAPLMRSEHLPRGLEVVPTAFGLALLVGTSEIGQALTIFLLGYWLLRSMLESPVPAIKDILGWSILAMLPMVAWFIWRNYLLANGVPLTDPLKFQTANFVDVILAYGETLSANPAAAFLIVIVLAMGLRRLLSVSSFGGIKRFLISESPLTFPMVMLIVYVFGFGVMALSRYGSGDQQLYEQPWMFLFHMQYLVILPIWLWLNHWYLGTTELRAWVAKTPGTLALVMCLVFMGLVIASKNRIVVPVSLQLDHTFRVANTMMLNKQIGWGNKVAVLDSFESNGYYAAALGYGLRHYSPVNSVIKEFARSGGDFITFHRALLKGGYEYLWVHTSTPDIIAMMGDDLQPENSYLFEITNTGLTFRNAYPHPGYVSTPWRLRY